jgi:hypothetical protein
MALVCIGEFTLQVSNSSTAFTSTEIEDTEAMMLVAKLENASIRYSARGATVAPTAGGGGVSSDNTEGSPLMQIGDIIEVWGQPDMLAWRGIRSGSTDGYLRVQVFGTGKS